jgi:hypothetical protein
MSLAHWTRWQAPKIPFAISVYAHRGGAEEAGLIENTVPAFNRSSKLNVR